MHFHVGREPEPAPVTLCDPLKVNKKMFVVKKAELPEHGEENIELLDYHLYIRNNETEVEIISELDDLIHNVCTV